MAAVGRAIGELRGTVTESGGETTFGRILETVRTTERRMSPNTLDQIFDKDVLIPILICGGIVVIVAIKAIAGVLTTASRERTRREIAAYIAEGTMSPEQ